MRFHVLALPHTVTSKDYCACAFTQKVLKMCAMLTRRGHTVYHYGHVESDVECTENVGVTDNDVLKKAYGDYDWKKEFFKHSSDDYAHKTFNVNAIVEVGKRKQPNDFLLCFWSQTDVAMAHADLIIVEPGIGCFNRLYAPYNVFESYALMNTVYGTMDNRIPSWSDCVIPNYFDPQDFEYKDKKGDYFLFMGRIIKEKGLKIAVETTKAIGAKLIVAGQGAENYETIMGGPPEPHVTIVGYADFVKRRKLLSGAKGLILASHYSEPFGGTVIEANMSGTPVITSDWGAFAETVVHGVTGYRCHTMEQFIWAAANIGKLSPKACYTWAIKNYSMDRIVLKYEEYFGTILNMREKNTRERKELDWLNIYYD